MPLSISCIGLFDMFLVVLGVKFHIKSKVSGVNSWVSLWKRG